MLSRIDLYGDSRQFCNEQSLIIKKIQEINSQNMRNEGIGQKVQRVDIKKWDILLKELSREYQMIYRLIKEVDDKTESLKITGTKIQYLRRQVIIMSFFIVFRQQKMYLQQNYQLKVIDYVYLNKRD
ncbi:unnamed protein product [Paramecium pentaurelia]|uniref:Uncharacterized protein n=1 Tax=Paramecium pentaurelia TaxID=43138 RepID=A0A8S1YHQ1_9CILI|nr:unnamed protein product [Paramecium pentaurelia]